MPEKKPTKKLTAAQKKAFAKIDFAQYVYDDGAPKMALRLLKEAEKVLGEYTVRPLMSTVKKEIKRRDKLMGRVKNDKR